MGLDKRGMLGNRLAKVAYELIGMSHDDALHDNEKEIIRDICEDMLELAVNLTEK